MKRIFLSLFLLMFPVILSAQVMVRVNGEWKKLGNAINGPDSVMIGVAIPFSLDTGIDSGLAQKQQKQIDALQKEIAKLKKRIAKLEKKQP